MRKRLTAFALSTVLLASGFGLLTPSAAYADFTEQGNEVNPYQLPDSSFIYDTSIAELAGADSYLDGQTVQVVGEAVGDNIRASVDGQHRWITLMAQDDSGASVTVYAPAHAASLVDTFGEYGATGTTLQVRGTFNLACPQHEGLSDLHADTVSVMRKGSVVEEPFSWKLFVPGAAFVVLGLLFMLVFRILRERLR